MYVLNTKRQAVQSTLVEAIATPLQVLGLS
jgi:hypothetical protein